MVVTAMDTRRPVILLELNELTPSIMDRFIAEGRLPNFKRLRDRSEVFVTDAQERSPYLEPWIQWVTVHTGVPYSEHKVFRLSEGHKAPQKRMNCPTIRVPGVGSYLIPGQLMRSRILMPCCPISASCSAKFRNIQTIASR